MTGKIKGGEQAFAYLELCEDNPASLIHLSYDEYAAWYKQSSPRSYLELEETDQVYQVGAAVFREDDELYIPVKYHADTEAAHYTFIPAQFIEVEKAP